MGARKSFGPARAEFIKNNCVAVAIPGGNSVSLQTATGKVLPGGINVKGLAEFNALPDAERKPQELEPVTRGRGLPPSGMLVIRAYIRGLERSPTGELRPDEVQSKKFSGPNRDFMWLTEAEWKSLLPKDPRPGQKLLVPDRVANRICCNHLADNTISIGFRPWQPNQRRAGDLALTVETVSPDEIRLCLQGSVRLANDADFAKATRRGDFRFLGFLNYDRKKEAFTRFDLVALAEDYHNAHVPEYYEKIGQKKSLALGIAFELATPDSLGYGTPPRAIRDGQPPQIAGYFGTLGEVDRRAVQAFFRKDK